MRQTKLTRDSFHVFQANARNALKQSEQVPSVLICAGTGCIAGGAMKIYENIKAECESRGLAVYVGLKHDTDEEKSLHVKMSGCHGFCEMGPLVHIEPMGVMYIHVKPEDCHEILEKTVLGGEVIDRLVYHLDGVAYPRQEDIPFYKKQHRVVLENCGSSDAEDIEEYIAKGGYAGFEKALFEMSGEEICKTITDSGLRGRGGGGFPAGRKWEGARKQKSEQKYIVCNGDEGDPGAFMDRAVIESDPHTLIEGMLIGAYAIGASDMYVYIRAEYPLAVERLSQAIEQARSRGLLGENILGTDFSCDLNIKIGAGAFVCGEETALIESMEGKRGMPRLKPPFPAQSGYLNEPSNINNVETFANVAWIIQHGGTAFAAMGTENSKGTKVFALTGKVQRGGLVEVPMGNSLKDVIFDIAGGIKDGRAYKAVQMGGPSGGCIPAALMDTPIDYKALSATGAIMGSGGMVVMDDSTCMVNIARFFLDFTARESCGKCVPCRIGTTRMMEILNRICEGEGQEGDIELLEELCVSIKDGALCGLGQTAPNPVLTTIRYFREEYEAHIRDKKCPAHECSALLTISIDPAKCTGCTVCARKCPVECISGTRKEPHVIDQSACIKCKQCVSSCKFGAIVVD